MIKKPSKPTVLDVQQGSVQKQGVATSPPDIDSDIKEEEASIIDDLAVEGPSTALHEEIDTLKDKLLRVAAEAENQRRRSERDMTLKMKFAHDGLARALLPVADNLRRALQTVDSLDKSDPSFFDSMCSGLVAIEKELLAVFQQFHITAIDSVGTVFDPANHQAMVRVEDSKQIPGTIVEEFQTGYRLHDRLLRPSGVSVAAAPSVDKPVDSPTSSEE